jgi:hypothetical protein
MTHLRIVPMLALVAATASGCATLDANECRGGDWPGIGYRDGASGARREVLAEHEKACAEHGVRPDGERWYAGYRRGIVVFCTPENGFEVGLRNHRYGGVCPADLEPAFLARYETGQQLWKARSNMAAIDRDIRQTEQDVARTDDPQKRAAMRSHLGYLRTLRITATSQLAAMEAWARGGAYAPPPPMVVAPPMRRY